MGIHCVDHVQLCTARVHDRRRPLKPKTEDLEPKGCAHKRMLALHAAKNKSNYKQVQAAGLLLCIHVG